MSDHTHGWLTHLLPFVGQGGIIQEVMKLHRRPMDFPLHVWGARIDPEMEQRLAESKTRLVASGISTEDHLAMAAAIGEGLERYCYASLEDELKKLDSVATAWSASDLFDLPFLIYPAVSRLDFSRQAEQSPCKKMKAFQCTADHEVTETEIPVQFLTGDCPPIDLFQTTNGMACGISVSDAACRGLREVVERDALMLAWLFQSSGTPLNADEVLEKKHMLMIEKMVARGIRVLFRDISTELGYRVVLAVVISHAHDTDHMHAFGAGADLNLQAAAAHAFQEACLSWKSCGWRAADGDKSPNQDIPLSFVDHADAYNNVHMAKKLSFLFDSTQDEGNVTVGDCHHLQAAAAHAFQEACLSWKSCGWRAADGDKSPNQDIPLSFVDHADAYNNVHMAKKLSFLFDSTQDEGNVTVGDCPPRNRKIDLLGEMPNPGNRDVYVINLTPPDVALMGAHVVKIIVPGLLPLTIGELNCHDLAFRRLPATLGGKTLGKQGHSINELPHPWP